MPVLARSQARARQPLAHAVSSKAGPLGRLQPHHQSFLSNLPWKEVSVVAIEHLEVIPLLWLWGMKAP